MVEHYNQNAGTAFAAELDILTADMRSGSYEAALTRFEARFNSPLLSDVVRGSSACCEETMAFTTSKCFPTT